MRKVAIVMGSKSDLPVAEKAVGVLRDYGCLLYTSDAADE